MAEPRLWTEVLALHCGCRLAAHPPRSTHVRNRLLLTLNRRLPLHTQTCPEPRPRAWCFCSTVLGSGLGLVAPSAPLWHLGQAGAAGARSVLRARAGLQTSKMTQPWLIPPRPGHLDGQMLNGNWEPFLKRLPSAYGTSVEDSEAFPLSRPLLEWGHLAGMWVYHPTRPAGEAGSGFQTAWTPGRVGLDCPLARVQPDLL